VYPVTVIRHPKERISKCSLKALHDRDFIMFLKATKGFVFDATNYITLSMGAPTLSLQDAGNPVLLLDSTWRLLEPLTKCITGKPIYRTLPSEIGTAYPRVSKISEDPLGGLASIEALYIALKILGEDDVSLLQDYHWRDEFLAKVERAGW